MQIRCLYNSWVNAGTRCGNDFLMTALLVVPHNHIQIAGMARIAFILILLLNLDFAKEVREFYAVLQPCLHVNLARSMILRIANPYADPILMKSPSWIFLLTSGPIHTTQERLQCKQHIRVDCISDSAICGQYYFILDIRFEVYAPVSTSLILECYECLVYD